MSSAQRPGRIRSVNIGSADLSEHTSAPSGRSGIGKRPVEGPVAVADPGPRGTGGSGLAGDQICDRRFHGGDDQAVYAYAEEDLRDWSAVLGRELTPGMFGENLTTVGVDVSATPIGQRWRIGGSLLLEVTLPRIACRTFAGELGEKAWIRRFTERATPGGYLRVLEPGPVCAGDAVEIVESPGHRVTIELAFRALTTESALRPRLLEADALPDRIRAKIEGRSAHR